MLLYMNTRQAAAILSERLVDANHSCGWVQVEDKEAEKKFADGKLRVLVVTDFSVIRDYRFLCKLVIHYDECKEADKYYDRVAHMPRGSISLLLLTKTTMHLIGELEGQLATSIDECPATIGRL